MNVINGKTYVSCLCLNFVWTLAGGGTMGIALSLQKLYVWNMVEDMNGVNITY